MTSDREKLLTYAGDPLAFFEGLAIPAQGPRGGPVRFGDAMADFQRKDFAALARALLAIKEDRKPDCCNFWIERTKGGGKDSDLACCIVWLLIFVPRPLLIQVAAANSDQADVIRDRIKALLRLNPWIGELIRVINYRVSNDRVESRCDIIATDEHGAPGPMPDLLLINELSEIQNSDFIDNLEENAAKSSRGVRIIATNAGHLDTFQHKRREAIKDSPAWYFSNLEGPAPWSDPVKVEERRRTTSPNRFNRLWLGIWTPDSGDAIDPADIQASLKHDGPMAGDEPWRFVGGFDGAVKRDNAAVVIIGKNRSLRLRLAWVQVWRPQHGRIEQEAVENALVELYHRFHLTTLAYDPSRVEYLVERLVKRGVRTTEIVQGPASLKDMASCMMEAFASSNLELFDHPQLLHDLGRLQLVEMSYGTRLKSPRESGQGHGDTATALALAMLAARDLPGFHEFCGGGPVDIPHRDIMEEARSGMYESAAGRRGLYGLRADVNEGGALEAARREALAALVRQRMEK